MKNSFFSAASVRLCRPFAAMVFPLFFFIFFFKNASNPIFHTQTHTQHGFIPLYFCFQLDHFNKRTHSTNLSLLLLCYQSKLKKRKKNIEAKPTCIRKQSKNKNPVTKIKKKIEKKLRRIRIGLRVYTKVP